MPQHDYDLANQAGAAFRSDANSALAAIVSNNSGASAPATTYAYQFWADTTTGLLKMRNAANSAWITICDIATWGLASVQNQAATAYVTGGTSTAFTLTPAPAISANAKFQMFFAELHTAPGASPTLAISGQTALNFKYVDSTGAKQFITSSVTPSGWKGFVFNDGTDYVALNILPSASGASPVIGSVRNGLMSITAASATATFTADEIICGAALGGTMYKAASFSQQIILTNTGAGGMDTGSAPANGFVAIYAIMKADGTKQGLACNVTTSSGSVYSGANMPAGYIASALAAICPTNGSGQFLPGLVQDRKFDYQSYVAIFTAHAVVAPLTSQSISAAVPAAARTFSGFMGSTNLTSGPFEAMAAADATGTGARGGAGQYQNGGVLLSSAGGMATMYAVCELQEVPIITAQTTYIACGGTAGNTNNFYVSGYTF